MRWVVTVTGWAVREFIDPEGAKYIAILEKDTARANLS